MANYRTTLFVSPERRRRQLRLAQRRKRERDKARKADANPAIARAAAAERTERGAAAALVAILGGDFDAEAVYRAVHRYRTAFKARMETAAALESVKLRKRAMPDGANPLLRLLGGDGDGESGPDESGRPAA